MGLVLQIYPSGRIPNLHSLITICQTFWFFVRELQRFYKGLPMTTLELTAISFSLVMFATSVTWYHKPSISRPRFIPTKNGETVQDIRDAIQREVSEMISNTDNYEANKLFSDSPNATGTLVSDAARIHRP